jgi:hypothetical protein
MVYAGHETRPGSNLQPLRTEQLDTESPPRPQVPLRRHVHPYVQLLSDAAAAITQFDFASCTKQ